MSLLHVIAGCLFLTLLPCAGAQTPQDAVPSAQPRPFRGLWVTRWDYVTEDDVRRAIRQASELGTTDVIWQVRGQADAYYDSAIEPWGEDLLRDRQLTPELLRKGPGFDPLALALSEAHDRGMRLHAWINVMPLWKGTTPPKNPDHLWHRRPELRLQDLQGHDQPLNEHYVIINPVLDESHELIVSVVRDIVTRYPVDGIHMDYIRFVSDTMDPDRFYPGDDRSLALYARDRGRAFRDTPAGRADYRDWVRLRITSLVRRIRTEGTGDRDGVTLSAAVWRRPELGRDQYLQDAANWIRQGLIDLAIPMIYADDDERFRDDLSAWMEEDPGDRVIPGIGAYRHADGGQTVRQIRMCPHQDRYVLFAYPWFYESRSPEREKGPEGEAARLSRRSTVQQFHRENR